jgi:hypothetical protein
MDTNATKLLKQIRHYHKSTAAHQKAKQALHVRQSRALGRSDKEMQKLLKTMGADVPSLLKETAAKERELREAHKTYLKGASLVRASTSSSPRSEPTDHECKILSLISQHLSRAGTPNLARRLPSYLHTGPICHTATSQRVIPRFMTALPQVSSGV